MTYIQPNKKSLTGKFLFALAMAVVSAVLWLIVLYNGVVGTEHAIVNMRAELKEVQIENAQIKEKMLALFDPENFREIAGHGLVQDRNPEYLEIGLASR